MTQPPVVGCDGSRGDVDYGVLGVGYSTYRQPDPHIATRIHTALQPASTILNVGAGAGSYEPFTRSITVTAVEPSATMRAQRPPHMPPAIDASAEALPFPSASFDAAMATFTVHQWRDLPLGLRELRRVTRGPIAILTCDPGKVRDFWLYEYAPEVLDVEATRYPSISAIAEALQGDDVTAEAVPIPLACTDGFAEGYYGRPEKLLEKGATKAMSAWSFVGEEVVQRTLRKLREDLDSGRWDERWGELRRMAEYEGSLVLVVAKPQRVR